MEHDARIMVWRTSAANGIENFLRFHGIVDIFVRLDLFENGMPPSADMLVGRENYIFQQDNDPQYTAIIVRDLIAA